MAFALAVTWPEAGNIGGGGFWTSLDSRRRALVVDFREMAPAKASPTMFIKDGKYSAELHHNSYLAVGVPGTVDFDRLYRIVDALDEIARERGATIAQVAINWVLHKPCVDTVILGARNEDQLKDILKSADFRLTPEESARLDEVSALPEPYPQWHQHKFGIERNPVLPARRQA